MNSIYRDWTKVDDLALTALKLSLYADKGLALVDRIASDYMTDIGAIGLLRQMWLESGSIDQVSRVYWSSRREPESPRIESLLAQLLMNLAASGIFEAIKEIATQPAHVIEFLTQRGVDLGALNSLNFSITEAWEQLTRLWQLHRWKNQGETERAQRVIRMVLDGGIVEVEADAHTLREIERLRRNLEAAVRGIVRQEIERDGRITLPENGRRYSGAPASAGCGQGRPIPWRIATEAPPNGEFILLIPHSASIGENLMLIMEAKGVVTTAGPISHIQVLSRGMKRPAVLVSEDILRDLESYGHLIVDGAAGKVAGFFERMSR